MDAPIINCPLCNSVASSPNMNSVSIIQFNCPTCRQFRITHDAKHYLSETSQRERDELIAKFIVVREVYGEEVIPTVWTKGNGFEIRFE